jgi:radical SAM superfamily enzyme YgiQ (UPF0313 family)
VPTVDLVEILRYLREKFPSLKRITSYARARTLKRKSPGEMIQLREAGLNRIHVGMESGSATVLKLIKKGLRPDEIIEGGRRVVEADISLS